MKRTLIACCLLTLAWPVCASQPRKLAQTPATQTVQAAAPTPPAATPESPTMGEMVQKLRGYFTPEETETLYQYLRSSLLATLKGQEVAEDLPPDLTFKLEVLLARMKKESGAYMDALSQQIERDLKKRLEAPPPTEYKSSNPYLQQYYNNPYLQQPSAPASQPAQQPVR